MKIPELPYIRSKVLDEDIRWCKVHTPLFKIQLSSKCKNIINARAYIRPTLQAIDDKTNCETAILSPMRPTSAR